MNLGVNRKIICNYLLVINSNYGRSSSFEILTFKARKWFIFPTPPLFEAPAGEPVRIS